MFEPKDYHSKRAALNEIALQQLMNIVYRSGDQNTRAQLEMLMNQFGNGQQKLRDEEANRQLGGVFQGQEGVEYASPQLILDYLKANVGRTYFGTEEHTSAPQGSIGTAEFGTKFKDWIDSLPNYDASISTNMQSGFYVDTMTRQGQKIPVLVLAYGTELITVVFHVHVSIMVLNLAYVPTEYNWANTHHYALRGEMYSYRNNLTVADLESLLSQALAAHTNLPLNKPAALPVSEELVTSGYSQVLDEAPAPEVEITVTEGDWTPDAVEAASQRGLTTVTTPIDEAGYVEVDAGGEAPPVLVGEEAKAE